MAETMTMNTSQDIGELTVSFPSHPSSFFNGNGQEESIRTEFVVTDNVTKFDIRIGADSGYASYISTPMGNPEDAKVACNEVAKSPTRSPTKGRANGSISATLDSEQIAYLELTLLWSKSRKLKYYPNLKVPSRYQNRFNDLKELFCRPLSEVFMSKPPMSPLAMKLKMLGESEIDAKPWILVLCDRNTVKLLKNFFRQKWVKQELDNERDHFEVKLDIALFERPPYLSSLTAGLSIFAFSKPPGWLEMRNTLCGRSIMTLDKGYVSVATIGGIVKVSMPDGSVSLYAMTCGHFLNNPRSEIQPNPEGQHEIFSIPLDNLEDGSQDEVDLEDSHNEEHSQEDDEDLFPSDCDTVYKSKLEEGIVDLDDSDPYAKENFAKPLSENKRLGHIVASSYDLLDNNTALDWMLFSTAIDYCLPNTVSDEANWEKSDLIPPRSKLDNIGGKIEVVAVTAFRGTVNGWLSLHPSSFMAPYGRGWIDTFEFTTSDPKSGECLGCCELQ